MLMLWSFTCDEMVECQNVSSTYDRDDLKHLCLCLDSTGGKAAWRTRTADVAASSRRRIISLAARSSNWKTKGRRYDAAGKVLVTIL